MVWRTGVCAGSAPLGGSVSRMGEQKSSCKKVEASRENQYGLFKYVWKSREREQDSSLTQGRIFSGQGRLEDVVKGRVCAKKHTEGGRLTEAGSRRSRAGETKSPGRGLDSRWREQEHRKKQQEKDEKEILQEAFSLAGQDPTKGGKDRC